MFTDSRSVTMDEEALKNQDMSQWDEETTRKILAKKNTVPVNASDKVCFYLLRFPTLLGVPSVSQGNRTKTLGMVLGMSEWWSEMSIQTCPPT